VKENRRIGIELDQKHIGLNAQLLYEDKLNLDRLRVSRSLYKTDKEVLALEKVRTDTAYEFQYDTPRTIAILFQTNNYELIDRIGNLTFFVVTLKNGKELLLIAYKCNKKALVLLYGVTQKQFEDALVHVGSKKRYMYENIMQLPESQEAFLIPWSAKMTILDGLLKHSAMRMLR
jgi:hypothetical protein